MEAEKSELKMPKTDQQIQTRSWIELPKELTSNILHRLGAVEILESAQRVCTTWLKVCKDPLMWRIVDLKNKGRDEKNPDRLYHVFRRAVHLSQGRLMDIRFEYFGTDYWLSYLTACSPQLRCIRIASCKDIQGKLLAAYVKEFKLLEELHLFDMRTLVSAEHTEAIGRACPNLKSFTYDHSGFHEVIKSDGLALAVAKTMPNLLHIRLFGNKLTNKGLQAILDAYTHLESLDLRQCYNVVLEGDLEKRCSEQIKSLKRPLDSTVDEWVPVNHPDTVHGVTQAERISSELRDYQEHNLDIYCFKDPVSPEYEYNYYECDCCYDSDSSGGYGGVNLIDYYTL